MQIIVKWVLTVYLIIYVLFKITHLIKQEDNRFYLVAALVQNIICLLLFIVNKDGKCPKYKK